MTVLSPLLFRWQIQNMQILQNFKLFWMFVDGYDRCNHKESLPPPFEERPRQYEPFLCSIIGKTSELDTKDETTSGKTVACTSCLLWRTSHNGLLNDIGRDWEGIAKVPNRESNNGKDKYDNSNNKRKSKMLKELMESLMTSMGQYVYPDTYIKFLLPRIVGDVQSETLFSESQSIWSV